MSLRSYRIDEAAMLWLAAALVALGGLVLSPTAAAHESRPLYIEIAESNLGAYQIAWIIPASIPAYKLPTIVLPKVCAIAGESIATIALDDYQGRRLIYCTKPLSGMEVAIRYSDSNPAISTMIRVSMLNGEEHTGLLGPQESSWQIPENETVKGVARQYMIIGIEHIWDGWDHLLFLVCLVWISGNWLRVLVTVTGFSIAHSLTLVVSTLEIVRLPVPPVEAAIALSIVFLAREIAIDRRKSITWRHPIVVSSSFGLLHGLGFAAILSDIGLPQTQLYTGLIFFNVGVEIGQVVFVAGIAAIIFFLRSLFNRFVRSGPYVGISQPTMNSARLASAYGAGIISCFWLIERLVSFVPIST